MALPNTLASLTTVLKQSTNKRNAEIRILHHLLQQAFLNYLSYVVNCFHFYQLLHILTLSTFESWILHKGLYLTECAETMYLYLPLKAIPLQPWTGPEH